MSTKLNRLGANKMIVKNHDSHESHTGHQGHGRHEEPIKMNPIGYGHEAHKDGGHMSHHAHVAADFRKRFWISLSLSIPILFLSPMIQFFMNLKEVLAFTGDIHVL